MKAPVSWLNRYVDMEGVDLKALCELLPLRGLEIAGIEELGADIVNVVVGRIVGIEAHPDSDHLLVCMLDVGAGENIQIVTGAPNVAAGDLVPVALDGSTLPGGVEIKKGVLRGVESCGMLCSGEELELKDCDYPGAEIHGILILREDHPLGMDIREALQLSDVVIEAEPTANRPDWQSIIGIAREVAAAIGRPMHIPELVVKEEASGAIGDHVRAEVADADLCPRYMLRSVKDIKIEPSPIWMRRALRGAGQRPINNIVDITNFVMFEAGQPMHAFDMGCVADDHIIVRRSRASELIETLDHKQRLLPNDTLLITDETKPVGIAGVMGGVNSEITDASSTVLFESAKFDGANIRRVVKAMGMMSDAASRFIKGIDIETTAWALERACMLVEELGAGKVERGILDICDPKALERKTLVARPERVNALLSTDCSAEQMKDILNGLFIPTAIEGGKLVLTLPHFRDDMEGEADVAEEVARVLGHGSIAPTLMRGDLMRGRLSDKQAWRDRLQDALCGMGAFEVCTYAFTGPQAYDMLRVPEGNPLRRCVKLSNPFGDDSAWMRTTLLTGMLPVLATNAKRKAGTVRFFELGRVHAEKTPDQELPIESERLCLGFYGEGEDFYTLKGAIEALAAALDLPRLIMKAGGEDFFHPGRKARIHVGDSFVGMLGEIHPDVADAFGIPGRAYVAELDPSALFETRIIDKQYKPLSRVPSVSRDLALIVPRALESAAVEAVIRASAGDTLESVTLFDIYEGAHMPEGQKSMAYTLVFRHKERTLTDEEVQGFIDEVLAALKQAHGIELRS